MSSLSSRGLADTLLGCICLCRCFGAGDSASAMLFIIRLLLMLGSLSELVTVRDKSQSLHALILPTITVYPVEPLS